MKIVPEVCQQFAHNMVHKNLDGGRIPNLNTRATRHLSKVSPRQGGTPPKKRSPPPKIKSSVSRLNSSQGTSPSPQGHSGPSASPSLGLMAGHYAGCKFAEPPQPSALPLPPRTWMQTSCSVRLPFHPVTVAISHKDVVHQMSMLLKAQA